MPDHNLPDNAVLRAVRSRRSIRRFTGVPVERDELLAVLEAGRWAPSGLNNQPCRFLVVGPGDARKEELAAHTKYAHIVRACDVLIVVLLRRDRIYNQRKDHQAAGAAVQNMLLAAHSLELGAVWLGEIVNQEPQVVDVLGLDPEVYELQAVIALGRPAQKGSSERLPLSEIVLEDHV